MELTTISHYHEKIQNEFFDFVSATCGFDYAEYVTYQKMAQASIWFNSLRPRQQVDNIFNRRTLRRIYFSGRRSA